MYDSRTRDEAGKKTKKGSKKQKKKSSLMVDHGLEAYPEVEDVFQRGHQDAEDMEEIKKEKEKKKQIGEERE